MKPFLDKVSWETDKMRGDQEISEECLVLVFNYVI